MPLALLCAALLSAAPGSAAAAATPAPDAHAAPATPAPAPAPAPARAGSAARDALVDVQTLIPDLVLDLRYATPQNFLKAAVYPTSARCYLRRPAAERLARVATRLRAQDGTRLRAFDCYRPHRVQFRMWELYPVKGYVANPATGSTHNRGGAIDLTLASADGAELPMPTPFDEFSRRAWHSYAGATKEEAGNRAKLRAAMEAEGFLTVRMEWWHYEDPDRAGYGLLDVPFEELSR